MNEIKVSIIIPAYNEENTIKNVVDELINYNFPFNFEIIIVNDGSTDKTEMKIKEFLNTPNIKLINYTKNRGYGASLKSGIKKAEGEYIVTYDGDGQFFPEEISKFFDEITKNDFDIVIGERGKLYSGSPLWRTPGKYLIRLLINSLIGIKIKDFNCGLRIVKRKIISRYLHLCSDKFSFSTTSTMVLINRGYNYSFFPIEVRQRNEGESSVKLFSGFNTIYLVLKMIMLFNPLKIFFPSGIIFIIFGVLWGAKYFFEGHGLSVGGFLFIIVGILSLFLGLIADQISEIRKSQFEDK